MKAILYTVSVDGAYAIEGSVACATLKEALKVRKGAGAFNGKVERVETADLPLRELLAAIYNREGFSAKATTIREQFERGEGEE